MRNDQRARGILIVVAVLVVTATTAAAISAFGGSGIEQVDNPDGSGERVRTAGERCAVPLLDGWTWRPASWTLIMPSGTMVGFHESLHGRPVYPEWDEMVDDAVGRYEDRDDIEIIREDEYVRIDFGENAGLSVIQRFDRVGCHLTFSPATADIRAQEIELWEQLISSVERTYPQE